MTVRQRLIDFIKYKKLSQAKFEKSVGFSNGYVNNIVKSIPQQKLDKITEVYPELNTAWLILEQGEMLNSLEVLPTGDENINKITKYKPSTLEQLIPFWEVDFIAGNGFDAVDNKSTQPTYYMDIPDFRGCTAFKAFSDSMEGLIKSGSILFGTKVERWHEHLEFGQIYGIVCQDGRKYLKYIKKYREDPKNFFLLESENKFYDEFEMPKESIRSIWLIHGHLSKRI